MVYPDLPNWMASSQSLKVSFSSPLNAGGLRAHSLDLFPLYTLIAVASSTWDL